jgi:hypothetical protein
MSKRNVKLILKVLSDLEPLRGSSNKKTVYSTRSCVNLAFFGTRGPLKRSFHSRFKMAHACQKRPNLHTNSSNKLLLFFIIRKNYTGITFFASFETLISVIEISVLIYCILITLTFSVKIWTLKEFLCYTYILLQLASFVDKLITFFKMSLEQRIYLKQCWTGFRHIITKLNEK